MEIERDFGAYLPKQLFIQPAGHADDSPYGKYAHDSLSVLFQKTIVYIMQYLESIYGTLYAFPESDSILTQEQKKMLQTLYRHKIIDPLKIFLDPPFHDVPKMFNISLRPVALREDAFIHIAPSLLTLDRYHAGHSFQYFVAVSKAIGELLERYALLPWRSYFYKSLRSSTRDMLEKKRLFLNPESLMNFGEKQTALYSNLRLEEDNSILWVRGKTYPEQKTIFLPAQTVFWGYNAEQAGEHYIREANTNGAAGMFSENAAILSGLYELIQRDGFLIFWLNTLPPPRIDPVSIDDEEVQEILSHLRRYRFEVEILDVTTDIGVPSFVVLLLDGAKDQKKVFIGGGAHALPEIALKDALAESLSIYQFWRRSSPPSFSLPDSYQPFTKTTPIGQLERWRLWANPAMFPRIQWFLAGKLCSLKERRQYYETWPRQSDHLSLLAQKLKSLGNDYGIYYYDARLPILTSLHFKAVKIIVPALVPLYLTEYLAPLTAKRLQEIPKKLGYTSVVFPNLLPHPFP